MRRTWTTRRARTSTMRTSLGPSPADTVHRKRPSGVIAVPPGKLPSRTSEPYGRRWRSVARTRVFGLTTGGLAALAAAGAIAHTAPATTAAQRAGITSDNAPG